MQELKSTTKLFKNGNSFGFRLTKKEKEFIHAEPGEIFEKEISPDGQVITFKKKKAVSSDTMALIDQLFDENQELMERLKDK